jgi:hypothetical protein
MSNEPMPVESFEMAEPTAVEAVENASPVYRKQSMNIYTSMLVISFVCLLVAIIALAIELKKWGGINFPYRTNSAKPTVSGMLELPFYLR